MFNVSTTTLKIFKKWTKNEAFFPNLRSKFVPAEPIEPKLDVLQQIKRFEGNCTLRPYHHWIEPRQKPGQPPLYIRRSLIQRFFGPKRKVSQ